MQLKYLQSPSVCRWVQFILRPPGGDTQLGATVRDADVNKAAWLPDDRVIDHM